TQLVTLLRASVTLRANNHVIENWSYRTLKRQIESSLFLRLAASRDKEGILSLAHQGQIIQTPDDIIKDTYTLEFLNIPENKIYSESDL
ncbi:MAG: hypothetical protein LUH02_09320, partial [Erysipelotrichaceae bacterium]|nr:hypothetical protein [Erysipelotrichaceae bacterium]